MKNIKFNNRENECLNLAEGGIIWNSRSIAVAVIALFGDQTIITQRAHWLPEGGKWCFPCGYLDWDESLQEGASRELYEETGIWMPAHKMNMWHIFSTPSSKKQNIVAWFYTDLNGPILEENVITCDKEVIDFKIINIEEVGDYDMAFNHNVKAMDLIQLFNEKTKRLFL